jgi:hypothetical protein
MKDVYKYDRDGQYNAIESIQEVINTLQLDLAKSVFVKNYNQDTNGIWKVTPPKLFAKKITDKMVAVERPLLLSEMEKDDIYFIPLWMAEDILGIEEADKLAAKKKELDQARSEWSLIEWTDYRTGQHNADCCGNIIALYQDQEGNAIEMVWDYHTYYKQVIMNAYTKHQIDNKEKWAELVERQSRKGIN